MKKEKLRFAQTMSGEHFITQGKTEISFNVNKLTKEELREILNGISNVLSGLSGALYNYEIYKKEN